MKRENFYIDGFNLYHSRLKKERRNRWLDLSALAHRLICPDEDVTHINYYTAYVSGKVDPDAVQKQKAYIAALKTLGNVDIHAGNFVISERWVKLVEPAEARPKEYEWSEPKPTLVKALTSQEKGSDVKLGTSLVRDAFQDKYDVAYVITNDTDLCEPIRVATEDLGKHVVITPPILPKSAKHPVPSPSLANVSSATRYIQEDELVESQFDEEVQKANGRKLFRPKSWHDGYEAK